MQTNLMLWYSKNPHHVLARGESFLGPVSWSHCRPWRRSWRFKGEVGINGSARAIKKPPGGRGLRKDGAV